MLRTLVTSLLPQSVPARDGRTPFARYRPTYCALRSSGARPSAIALARVAVGSTLLLRASVLQAIKYLNHQMLAFCCVMAGEVYDAVRAVCCDATRTINLI